LNVAASKLREWRERPITFVREVLRAEPDAWQAEVLEAFPTQNRIAMTACKGPGKSAIEAWCGWNFLLTRPHPKVVCTSITGDNLRDGLWTEFAKWQQNSELLKRAFHWSAERIVAKDHPETWWASARQWSKGADPAQQAHTLAGIHADFVMFIVDEAGGVPDAVMAAAEAGLANADPERGTEAKLLIGGNPTHLDGPLYRANTRERKLWFIVKINSIPGHPKRTPRVSEKWAQEQIDKYGWDSPFVLVNVRGEFPPAQSNALLGVDDATEAAARVIPEVEFADEVRVLGVDVARFGDDETVLFPRQGRAAMRPKVFRNIDTMATAGQVAMVLERWKPDGTFIDVTGIGAGVVDRLLQLGFPVIGVDFGGKPLNGKFANRRAEMWFTMADWVKGGGCIPDDPTLIGELPAPTYHFTPDGRLALEKKEDMKKRGLQSPNRADALALTFAAPVAHRGFRGQVLQGLSGPRVLHDYDPYQEL